VTNHTLLMSQVAQAKGEPMNITTLTKDNLRVVRDTIDKELKLVADRFGITLQLGNCKFNSRNATFELIVNTMAEDGVVLSKEAISFKNLAGFYGMKPEHLNAIFENDGRMFRLVGLNPKRPKFPFVALCLNDNKTYKMTQSSVQRGFVVSK
jgi:hypothetical protein